MKTETLPKTMRAAVYRGDSRVVVEELPTPKISRGEALVRINTCGVCHTDLKKVSHNLLPAPRVFGHEMAGTIVALGAGTKGWKIGDRVAVFHHIPCGKCFYCERNEYAQCPVYKKTGTVAAFEPAGGGFAQFIRVMPWIVARGSGGMVKIPKKNTFAEASFIEPVNTCLKGVDRMGLRRGDTVLIFGQGPIGLIFTQLVKARGGKAVGLDLLPNRCALAKKLGAAWALDPRDTTFKEKVLAATNGRGADAAILAVPSEAAAQQALAATRPGGKVLLFAHTKKGDAIALDAGVICVDEKTVLGSYSASVDVTDEVARLIFSRKVKVAPLISHRFKLDQIQDAFDLAHHPTPESMKIVVEPWA
jgi:L-iditol 2-dehydrogenase